MSTVTVEYCGQKPQETDCVAGTGLTWVGLGSKHEVSPEAWLKMAEHPDVWKLADSQKPTPGLSDAKPAAEAVEAADGDKFDGMDDESLQAYVKQNHLSVHHKMRGDKLRAAIREAIAD